MRPRFLGLAFVTVVPGSGDRVKELDLGSGDTQKEPDLGSGDTQKELDLKQQYDFIYLFIFIFFFFENHPKFHENMCLIPDLNA